MKTRLVVGAEIDLLTSGELRKELADHRHELARMLNDHPITRTVSATITLDASGNGTIDLGQPGPGRTWNVKRVSAVYQDVAAALAAGIAILMRGNDPTNPLNFVERIPNGTQLPASDRFSADQVVLQQDEHLFIRIAGGTVSVPVFGSAQVVDARKGAVYEYEDEDQPKLSSVV